MPDKNIIIEKIKNNINNTFGLDEFILNNVDSDVNCWYRAIALQLYSNEIYYNKLEKIHIII